MEGQDQGEMKQDDMTELVLSTTSTLPYDNFSFNFLRDVDCNTDNKGGNYIYLSRYVAAKLEQENQTCKLLACKKIDVGAEDPLNHVCLLVNDRILIETSPLNSFFTLDLISRKFNDESPNTLVVEMESLTSYLIGRRIKKDGKDETSPLMRLQIDSLYDTISSEDRLRLFESIITGNNAGYVTRHSDGKVKFKFVVTLDTDNKKLHLIAELKSQKKGKKYSVTPFNKVSVDLSPSAEGLWCEFKRSNQLILQIYVQEKIIDIDLVKKGLYEWVAIRSKSIFTLINLES